MLLQRINGSLEDNEFLDVDDSPHAFANAFYQKCKDKIVIGGGQGEGKILSSVVEYHNNGWKTRLPDLQNPRKLAASCFVENRLIVAGGRDATDRLDSIEILEDFCQENSAVQWKKCGTNLPCKLEGHTLSVLKGDVYLIGGYSGGNNTSLFDRVWKGEIKIKNDDFSLVFKEVHPHMKTPRYNHFSIRVGEKIYIFGGEMNDGNKKDNVSEVEIFNGTDWFNGPKFDCHLNRNKGDGAVLIDDTIIITSRSNGIIVYAPTKGNNQNSIRRLGNVQMKDKRNQYVAFTM